MATSEEDTVAMSREPGGSGAVLVSEDPQHKTDLPGTTRTRKKVTFDLDLQVRTIPNRIPLYERRPAYNPASHAYARSNQAVAFVPRPLDIRTRDKYLIGAAHLSAKRIIDLFSVPNGHPGYPVPPKGQHIRPGQSGYRRQHQGYGAGGSAGNSANRHPAYTYAGMKSSKLSRAAANLKQITAALGEHFDSTVYQEWDTSRPANGRSSTAISAGTHRDTETVDNATPGGVSKHAPSQTPSQSFTPTRTRPYLPYRQQLNPHPEPQPNPSHDSESESNVTVSSLLDRSRSSSYPGTIPSSRRISTVNTEQISLKDKHLVITKAPATPQKTDARRRSDTTAYSGGERFRRVPSARDRERSDRAPSRCSTIDTYVISDNAESKSTPSNMNSRVGSARSTNSVRKAMPSSTKSRSVAWEGAELSVTEPALTANALRTSKSDHNTTTGSNWHVTSKQINL